MPKMPICMKLFKIMIAMVERNRPANKPFGAENVRPDIITYPVTPTNTHAATASATRIKLGFTMLATHSFDPRLLFDNPEGEVSPVPPLFTDPAGDAT